MYACTRTLSRNVIASLPATVNAACAKSVALRGTGTMTVFYRNATGEGCRGTHLGGYGAAIREWMPESWEELACT